MAAVTICSDFGAPKIKVCHCFHCFPIYLPWSDGNVDAMILVFWMLSFKPAFAIFYGEGNGTPLQYSCLENPMDGGAWWATVHGVALRYADDTTLMGESEEELKNLLMKVKEESEKAGLKFNI